MLLKIFQDTNKKTVNCTESNLREVIFLKETKIASKGDGLEEEFSVFRGMVS